jgi:hypothetical protein
MASERQPRADETSCANAIFQQPWWLDAVAPGRWDVRICNAAVAEKFWRSGT